MYLTYFDESGDTGVTKSSTKWFVLNAVLVHETVWLETLDALVAWRQQLRDSYGIDPRDELKGAQIRKGDGAFAGLAIPKGRRFRIFEEIMDFQAGLNIKTFSVAIHKERAFAAGAEPRMTAWRLSLAKLNGFCVSRSDYAALYPDEGNGFFIHQLVRSMRRRPTLWLDSPFQPVRFRMSRILEDPHDKTSQDSYLVQLADLNAYATHRHRSIDPKTRTPSDLWDRLKGPGRDIRLQEEDLVPGEIEGIMRYP